MFDCQKTPGRTVVMKGCVCDVDNASSNRLGKIPTTNFSSQQEGQEEKEHGWH